MIKGLWQKVILPQPTFCIKLSELGYAHSTLKSNTRVKNKPGYYLWLKGSAYLYLNIYERIQATESRVKIHNCTITQAQSKPTGIATLQF